MDNELYEALKGLIGYNRQLEFKKGLTDLLVHYEDLDNAKLVLIRYEAEYQLQRRKHVNAPIQDYDEKLVARLVHWSELLTDEEWCYQSVTNDELMEWLEDLRQKEI